MKVCIGKGYERMGGKIVFAKKKVPGSLFRQSTKYYRRYIRGPENIFVPKKGVKLEKC